MRNYFSNKRFLRKGCLLWGVLTQKLACVFSETYSSQRSTLAFTSTASQAGGQLTTWVSSHSSVTFQTAPPPPPGLPLQPGLSGQFLLCSEEMSRKFKVPVVDIVLLGRGKANPSWGGHLPKEALRRHLPSQPAAMEAFWPAEDGLTSLDDHDEWLDSASQGITTGYSKAHLPVISYNS